VREPEDRHWRQGGVTAEKKNPMPAVCEDQGNGIFLIAHGEPHDPCPVPGCSGPLLFGQWAAQPATLAAKGTSVILSRPKA